MWEVGGGAPGMITDVSETLGLDKVDSEVVVEEHVELQTGAAYVRMARMSDL